MFEISISTHEREEFVDMTDRINKALDASHLEDGFCLVMIPHTTAGITINEGADPDVKRDILHTLRELVPEDRTYRHMEGNSDAHVKCSLMGIQQIIPFKKRRLCLGQWQAVFLCEFDGPRQRKVRIHVFQ
jgi:secondary thiamine-phosphate synthase enzyme